MNKRASPSSKPVARLRALELLRAVFENGQDLGEAGSSGPVNDARDAAFARHLAYGVLRWYPALDWLARQMLQKPLKAKDRDIHWLLTMGLFQLWKDGTAQHAAVHETAECARSLGKSWAVGLINAVLRRFQREQSALLDRLQGSEARFAFPGWLLQRLQNDWPGEDWRSAVDQSNVPAALWLRLNRRHDAEVTLQQLQEKGFSAQAHPLAPDAVRIDPASPVSDLPGFAEGRFSVQDPAAQLAADLLPARPGDRVLDACAAPGGKTCHLLERYPGIELLALDRSEKRLEKVRENIVRLGLDQEPGLQLLAEDAARPDKWWDGKPFRLVLLDAPCTATGVIRRHPEIKWLRSADQVEAAATSQRRLLETLWPLVEPGGMLLYATCSMLHAENRDQVRNFSGAYADARLQAIDAPWGRDTGFGHQVLPGDHDMDGFFYALLAREA